VRLQLIAALIFVGSFVGAAPAFAQEEEGWRITTDTLLYTDTDNVLVVSPQVAVHKSTDEDGGSASARVVVDAVSAASVDVVSQATKRFSEVRTEANLGFSKSIGKLLPSATYRYSHEPDYSSHGFGVGLQRELGSSDTTLGLGYDISLDTVGYTGTPRSVFSESLISHGWVASLTQVLGPKTLVRGVYTLSLQNGYLEKPYRFVPLFDAAGIAMAKSDGVKIDLSNFDRYRLPFRPAEEVPNQRIGHAAGLRFLRYLDALPGAIHLDYQFFIDSWDVNAHTIEPRLYWKLSDQFDLAFYGRFYLQRAADFWQREYVVAPGQVPGYRTLDRDLSDYYALTGGSRLEWKGDRLSAYVDASAMETIYSDYLFLDSRLALIAQGGLRIQL
jgi:hypothetical protein